MILHAAHVYLVDGVPGAALCPYSHWLHDPMGVPVPGRQLPLGHAIGDAIEVVVNHSRWIVQCPICNSAQVAARDDHRFFCIECENGGRGWVTVIWPEDADAIEEVLMLRPDRNTRSWVPGETVEDLLAENDAHGVR